jgi:hypothetical protein
MLYPSCSKLCRGVVTRQGIYQAILIFHGYILPWLMISQNNQDIALSVLIEIQNADRQLGSEDHQISMHLYLIQKHYSHFFHPLKLHKKTLFGDRMGLGTQQHPLIYSPKQPLTAYIHCHFANQKGFQELFKPPKAFSVLHFSTNRSDRI